MRENVAALTAQCAQLDAANHAWQSYQQAQLDRLRNKISDYVPVEENMSLDDMTQELIDQLTQEREDFSDRFQTVERANDQLRSGTLLFKLNHMIVIHYFLQNPPRL